MPKGAPLPPRLLWLFLEPVSAASELPAYALARYLVNDMPGLEIHPEHHRPTRQKHPSYRSRFVAIPLYLGETTSNQPKRIFQEQPFAASKPPVCVRAQYSGRGMPSRGIPQEHRRPTKRKRLDCLSEVKVIALFL